MFNNSSQVKFLENNYECLFFGSSKFFSGIDPQVIKEENNIIGYNLASQGSGIVLANGLEILILQRYHPKLIVLEVMDLSLEMEARTRLAPYYADPKIKNLFSIYPFHINLMYAAIKSFRYNPVLLYLIGNYRSSELVNHMGYKALHGKRPQISEGVVFGKQPTCSAGEQLLKEFIERAIINRIKVLIIEMPTLSGDPSPSHDVYKKIATIYDVHFLDFSKVGIQDFWLSEDYFYDIDHLTDEGAKILSIYLAKKLSAVLKH